MEGISDIRSCQWIDIFPESIPISKRHSKQTIQRILRNRLKRMSQRMRSFCSWKVHRQCLNADFPKIALRFWTISRSIIKRETFSLIRHYGVPSKNTGILYIDTVQRRSWFHFFVCFWSGSDWPTFPQLYCKGELIGGHDIVVDMFKSGELHELLGVEDPEEKESNSAESDQSDKWFVVQFIVFIWWFSVALIH